MQLSSQRATCPASFGFEKLLPRRPACCLTAVVAELSKLVWLHLASAAGVCRDGLSMVEAVSAGEARQLRSHTVKEDVSYCSLFSADDQVRIARDAQSFIGRCDLHLRLAIQVMCCVLVKACLHIGFASTG